MLPRRSFLPCLPFALSPTLANSPSRITALRTHLSRLAGREYVFLEIETSSGHTGLGEASLPGKAKLMAEALAWLAPHLTGQDPAGIADHWNRLFYDTNRWRDGSVLMTALSAVDIALWDVEGKRLGVPTWRLLGGNNAKPLRVYYSHWSNNLKDRSPAALAEHARKTLAEGWTAVKWVIPRHPDERTRLANTVAEVAAIRDAVGDQLDIALEMYETFTVRSALSLARALAPYRLLFLEEPVWRESNFALGQVAAQSPIPLAGGEGLLHRWQFRDLLEAKGAVIVQPDVVHCGGITEIRRIAHLAEVYGAEVAPHMWYGPIAHLASLHSMSAIRNFFLQEFDGAHARLFHDLSDGTFPLLAQGHITLNQRPGLGLSLNLPAWTQRFPFAP
ncbi:MAG: mandelate racemase/muconate lactonizing enzyme family protein [Bryobacter sp.]|nr:mandelate racemase/muconate lactonizing enzyme family protein [Bryobacter sp.]